MKDQSFNSTIETLNGIHLFWRVLVAALIAAISFASILLFKQVVSIFFLEWFQTSELMLIVVMSTLFLTIMFLAIYGLNTLIKKYPIVQEVILPALIEVYKLVALKEKKLNYDQLKTVRKIFYFMLRYGFYASVIIFLPLIVPLDLPEVKDTLFWLYVEMPSEIANGHGAKTLTASLFVFGTTLGGLYGLFLMLKKYPLFRILFIASIPAIVQGYGLHYPFNSEIWFMSQAEDPPYPEVMLYIFLMCTPLTWLIFNCLPLAKYCVDFNRLHKNMAMVVWRIANILQLEVDQKELQKVFNYAPYVDPNPGLEHGEWNHLHA